jgi:prepilin-type N-terminal cleavage/methylation domain-containing protein
MILAKRRDGITAIELMAVIAILGILVVIGVLRLREYYREQKLNRAVQELVGDLRIARQLSKTHQTNTTVEFIDERDHNRFEGYLIVRVVRRGNNTINDTISDKRFQEILFTPNQSLFTFDERGRTNQTIGIEAGIVEGECPHIGPIINKTLSLSISRLGKISY